MIIVQIMPLLAGRTSGGAVSLYRMVTMVAPLFGGTASGTTTVAERYIVITMVILTLYKTQELFTGTRDLTSLGTWLETAVPLFGFTASRLDIELFGLAKGVPLFGGTALFVMNLYVIQGQAKIHTDADGGLPPSTAESKLAKRAILAMTPKKRASDYKTFEAVVSTRMICSLTILATYFS